MPQPYLVPVRFSMSRKTQSSGVSPATLHRSRFAVDGKVIIELYSCRPLPARKDLVISS